MTVETRLALVEERQTAAKAWEDRHQNECTQRFQLLDGQVTRVHSRIDKLLYIQLTTAVTAVLSMGVLIAQLLMRHGP